MPDDFVMQLHRFWERQRLPSQRRVLPRFRFMPLNSLRISLCWLMQFSFRRIHSGQPSVIHITTSKGDSTHKTPQRRHSAFTEYAQQPSSGARHTRKQPALARFSPDIAPLFVHFSADNHITVRLVCARLPTAAWVFLSDVNRLRPTPIMRQLPGIQRHSWPYQWFSGAYRVEKRCKWTAAAMFYGSESRDSADVRRCFCRYAPPVSSWTGGTAKQKPLEHLKTPSYTKSVSWQHHRSFYLVTAPGIFFMRSPAPPQENPANNPIILLIITNRPEQVHFKAKALPNFYPQYHIVSRK